MNNWCFVEGRPVPKERPRVANGHAYTPRKTKDYEELVALRYKQSGGIRYEGPLQVQLSFRYQSPKSWPKKKREANQYRASKPDLDNLIKAVLDGLNGVAWNDDAQVVYLSAWKSYTDVEEGVYIYIEELEEEDEGSA